MTTSTYQYEPLTAPARIRVLLLAGGSGPVFANLVETTVPGGIPYEAISYVWGDPAKPHMINLGGGETLPITASLHNALKSIRRPSAEDGVRAVWADAVCINQADTNEKSQQVPMMATIYRSATGVLTYVGQAECGKDNAKRGLELASSLVQLAESRRGLPVNPVLNTLSPEQFGLPPFREPVWDALREFISKPWSSRVWILQESLLGAHIRLLWGEHEIGWDKLRCLVFKVLQPMCYPRMSGLVPSEAGLGGLFHMFHLRDVFRTRGVTIPILTLLQSCRDLGSTDPRDRVFAVASLNDKDHSMPVADYGKDTRQVFIEAAAGLLRGEMGVMVLSYAGISGKQVDHHLPTWVPDWAVSQDQIPVAQCRGFLMRAVPFEMPAMERIDHGSGTLQLRGIVYDRIVHLTEKLHRGILSARMRRSRWARDQIIRLLKLGYYPSGGSYLDALWRTLVCDLDAVQRDAGIQAYMSNPGAAGSPRSDPRLYVSAPSTLAHDFEAWVSPDAATARREARNWVAANSGKGRMAPPPTDPVIKAGWMREQQMPDSECGERDRVNVFKSLKGNYTAATTTKGGDRASPGWVYRDTILRAGNLYRRLCTTEKGYIGVVPYDAKVGDVLLFVPGSTVPFVLREVRDGAYGRQQYRLVGDCFLHGLMSGHVFNEAGITCRSVTLV